MKINHKKLLIALSLVLFLATCKEPAEEPFVPSYATPWDTLETFVQASLRMDAQALLDSFSVESDFRRDISTIEELEKAMEEDPIPEDAAELFFNLSAEGLRVEGEYFVLTTAFEDGGGIEFYMVFENHGYRIYQISETDKP